MNSEGVPLRQADFAMSKIAANGTYGGNKLRKAIDYFCHLAVAPDFPRTEKGEQCLRRVRALRKCGVWLKEVNDDIYDPSYSDMLRVRVHR